MFVLRAFQTDNTPVPCERWQFTELPITIGRNLQNDYAPQHPAISNFHARIESRNGKVCIRDLGSSNGVYVAMSGGGEPLRISTNTAIELGPAGNRFFLSSSVWVQLDFVQSDGPAVPVQQQSESMPAAMGYGKDPRSEDAVSPVHASVSKSSASAPQHGSDRALESQCLNVGLDYLALQGLRELARSLLPGHRLETTGDIARLITKLHEAVDVFCRSFIPLRQGYEQFVSSLDLEARRSMRMSPSAAMLEVAKSPEAVALALLDPRDPSCDAARAAESILADLARHQIALLDGVMQGVRALLQELSPEKVESTLDQRGSVDLFGSKYRARWMEFCERYEKLSDERAAFAVIFGQDFADVYRRYWNREKGQ